MKRTLLTVLTLLTITASANAGTLIEGTKAKNLASALEGAGASGDCGAGRCGTEASDIQCLTQTDGSKSPIYSCTLSVPSETDTEDARPVSIARDAAKNLNDALLAADVQSDCGAGTCQVKAKSVRVNFRNSRNPPLESYQAEIN